MRLMLNSSREVHSVRFDGKDLMIEIIYAIYGDPNEPPEERDMRCTVSKITWHGGDLTRSEIIAATEYAERNDYWI